MSNDENPFAAGQAGDAFQDSPSHTIYEPVPLDVGAVLQRAFELLRDNPGTVLGAAILAILPGFALAIGDAVMQVVVAQADDADLALGYSFVSLGVSLFSTILNLFLQLGLIRILLNVTRGHDAQIGMLLSEGGKFLNGLGASILLGIVVLVGVILLIVPGIIAAIGLQFALYMVVDRNLGPIEALSQSWTLTDGNKLNLFLINVVFSLLGIVMVCFTLGLGYLLVLPLMTLAQAVMYHSLLHTHPEFSNG